MANVPSNGSPELRSRPSAQFVIHDDANDDTTMPDAPRQATSASKHGSKHTSASKEGLTPLMTSKLGNMQGPMTSTSGLKPKVNSSAAAPQDELQEGSMDSLLAKLSEQQTILAKQKSALTLSGEFNKKGDASKPVNEEKQVKDDSSASSALLTPASGSFGHSSPTTDGEDTIKIEAAEVARLKQELDAAKNQIARQKQELDQTRVIKHTFDQAIGSSSNAAISSQENVSELATNAAKTIRPFAHGQAKHEDFHTDHSEPAGPMNPFASVWSNTSRPNMNTNSQLDQAWSTSNTRSWGQRGTSSALPPVMIPPQQPMQSRNYSMPVSPVRENGRAMNDVGQYNQVRGFGQGNLNRNPPLFQRGTGWEVYAGGSGPMDDMNLSSMNSGPNYPALSIYPQAYQPQPIGTPLSPTAPEFRGGSQAPPNPWNNAPPSSPGQTYVTPMEPLNYRRLLDRSVTCNWKYIVDKIVCNNDQQASIFLQQKLKVGTAEQKYEIIEAIVAQAYPLMVNRFGNFLVQRCFEHGTPEQVISIANAIRGNTLSLSMDAFGCHVVQKAFDAVPEDYKAIMVHELLRRIPETVIHRYACHVWQKLFELRWSDSPPQIMKYVNEALCGMWHEVALGETGSLVVQNIFENCLEEDKRPCITEVLNSIDIVAHGQFGNWCIQHICEHGAPADRSRAIDHVLRYATEYSMDQFASKVVEKCLKIGGAEFLERYLDRVCEGRADRPRIPLIDIASDQYGNYLIQYILTHANPTHRDIVASHIRKHMVSLRGSKFGSRVGMLCSNPAYATHPGPGVGLANNRSYSAQSNIPRFGSAFR
ncbi:hypothetical protein ACLMJK_002139 [Lecanora helva]